ncbi:ExeA family protein [Psychrobium sp. 1_MG-2023]|uniref:ExeA family protein n=1 Tax=Psychrobium sp. 1_MG-2023 TaxID=3062624 RepID=UPI000C342659|nr:AAA family ATPase [Psychrobium sp. 1_MG-2023]MDP2560864.1 AAA family ATPase [Psychrobium sp. 1_MG-2023]PKF56737.1 AAA family ATPase [Alteromonadales bacterium alter-6D02]
MYLYHFGMRELPYTLTPNTDFFLNLKPHVEALQVLLNALKQGEGFIKVTGEVGTGKTLICRKLLNELPRGFAVAYIPNPYLSPQELRLAVAGELGLKFSTDIDQQRLTQLLQQHLLNLSQQGKAVVVILDEAQALPDESLEALRLLTNLETERRKLLQVVLFGQQELDERLAEKKFRQLRQRISFSYQLRSMTVGEVAHYIEHRTKVAGYDGQRLFSEANAKRIAIASKGIPRLVNILCHKSLLLCYGAGEKVISKKHVNGAIVDTVDASRFQAKTPQFLAASLLIAASLLLFSYLGNS